MSLIDPMLQDAHAQHINGMVQRSTSDGSDFEGTKPLRIKKTLDPKTNVKFTPRKSSVKRRPPPDLFDEPNSQQDTTIIAKEPSGVLQAEHDAANMPHPNISDVNTSETSIPDQKKETGNTFLAPKITSDSTSRSLLDEKTDLESQGAVDSILNKYKDESPQNDGFRFTSSAYDNIEEIPLEDLTPTTGTPTIIHDHVIDTPALSSQSMKLPIRLNFAQTGNLDPLDNIHLRSTHSSPLKIQPPSAVYSKGSTATNSAASSMVAIKDGQVGRFAHTPLNIGTPSTSPNKEDSGIILSGTEAGDKTLTNVGDSNDDLPLATVKTVQREESKPKRVGINPKATTQSSTGSTNQPSLNELKSGGSTVGSREGSKGGPSTNSLGIEGSSLNHSSRPVLFPNYVKVLKDQNNAQKRISVDGLKLSREFHPKIHPRGGLDFHPSRPAPPPPVSGKKTTYKGPVRPLSLNVSNTQGTNNSNVSSPLLGDQQALANTPLSTEFSRPGVSKHEISNISIRGIAPESDTLNVSPGVLTNNDASREIGYAEEDNVPSDTEYSRSAKRDPDYSSHMNNSDSFDIDRSNSRFSVLTLPSVEKPVLEAVEDEENHLTNVSSNNWSELSYGSPKLYSAAHEEVPARSSSGSEFLSRLPSIRDILAGRGRGSSTSNGASFDVQGEDKREAEFVGVRGSKQAQTFSTVNEDEFTTPLQTLQYAEDEMSRRALEGTEKPSKGYPSMEIITPKVGELSPEEHNTNKYDGSSNAREEGKNTDIYRQDTGYAKIVDSDELLKNYATESSPKNEELISSNTTQHDNVSGQLFSGGGASKRDIVSEPRALLETAAAATADNSVGSEVENTAGYTTATLDNAVVGEKSLFRSLSDRFMPRRQILSGLKEPELNAQSNVNTSSIGAKLAKGEHRSSSTSSRKQRIVMPGAFAAADYDTDSLQYSTNSNNQTIENDISEYQFATLTPRQEFPDASDTISDKELSKRENDVANATFYEDAVQGNFASQDRKVNSNLIEGTNILPEVNVSNSESAAPELTGQSLSGREASMEVEELGDNLKPEDQFMFEDAPPSPSFIKSFAGERTPLKDWQKPDTPSESFYSDSDSDHHPNKKVPSSPTYIKSKVSKRNSVLLDNKSSSGSTEIDENKAVDNSSKSHNGDASRNVVKIAGTNTSGKKAQRSSSSVPVRMLDVISEMLSVLKTNTHDSFEKDKKEVLIVPTRAATDVLVAGTESHAKKADRKQNISTSSKPTTTKESTRSTSGKSSSKTKRNKSSVAFDSSANPEPSKLTNSLTPKLRSILAFPARSKSHVELETPEDESNKKSARFKIHKVHGKKRYSDSFVTSDLSGLFETSDTVSMPYTSKSARNSMEYDREREIDKIKRFSLNELTTPNLSRLNLREFSKKNSKEAANNWKGDNNLYQKLSFNSKPKELLSKVVDVAKRVPSISSRKSNTSLPAKQASISMDESTGDHDWSGLEGNLSKSATLVAGSLYDHSEINRDKVDESNNQSAGRNDIWETSSESTTLGVAHTVPMKGLSRPKSVIYRNQGWETASESREDELYIGLSKKKKPSVDGSGTIESSKEKTNGKAEKSLMPKLIEIKPIMDRSTSASTVKNDSATNSAPAEDSFYNKSTDTKRSDKSYSSSSTFALQTVSERLTSAKWPHENFLPGGPKEVKEEVPKVGKVETNTEKLLPAADKTSGDKISTVAKDKAAKASGDSNTDDLLVTVINIRDKARSRVIARSAVEKLKKYPNVLFLVKAIFIDATTGAILDDQRNAIDFNDRIISAA